MQYNLPPHPSRRALLGDLPQQGHDHSGTDRPLPHVSATRQESRGDCGFSEVARACEFTTDSTVDKKMIKYHGTPIGGKGTDAAEVLRGRHALVSYAHKQDLPIVLSVCQSFVLDNGAFSEWRKTGEPVDFEGYVDWVKSLYRHPGFDWCLIPDIIDGEESDNVDLVNRWLRIGFRVKGVPIWHMHESLEYLEWLVDNFEWVALGSSGQWPHPGKGKWWDRMGEAMAVACFADGRPKCKLHGLRMLDPAIFENLPLASADSTNAGRNNNQLGRFGMYAPPSAGQRAATIAARIESSNSAPIWMAGPEQMDLGFA